MCNNESSLDYINLYVSTVIKYNLNIFYKGKVSGSSQVGTVPAPIRHSQSLLTIQNNPQVRSGPHPPLHTPDAEVLSEETLLRM